MKNSFAIKMKPIITTGLAVLLAITFVAGHTTHRYSNTTVMTDSTNRILIDRFVIPAAAREAFLQRMKNNRQFIVTQPGFINDEVYLQNGENGDLRCVTIAVWQNDAALANAKTAVQAEYKRTSFNPQQFMEQQHIQMERGVFAQMPE